MSTSHGAAAVSADPLGGGVRTAVALTTTTTNATGFPARTSAAVVAVAGPGKPPRSERKPRHKKSVGPKTLAQQQNQQQQHPTAEVVPHYPPLKKKKSLRKQLARQLRQDQHAARLASPTEYLLATARVVAASTGSVQMDYKSWSPHCEPAPLSNACLSEQEERPMMMQQQHQQQQAMVATAAAAHPAKHRLQIVTSCGPATDEDSNNKQTAFVSAIAGTTRIDIKPLLILDLNGILCHRIRRPHGYTSTATVPRSSSLSADEQTTTGLDDDPSNIVIRNTNNTNNNNKSVVALPLSAYRTPLGPVIAQTPIVSRPRGADWLTYLDRHFCLAVWTSGKNKTARALVQALVPPHVAERLLFVWAQQHCSSGATTTTTDGCGDGGGGTGSGPVQQPLHPSEIVYKKDLQQVWSEFPLWNASNTLLIDDSPDKCVAWRENAVHPPRLNGLRRRTIASSSSPNGGDSDLLRDDVAAGEMQENDDSDDDDDDARNVAQQKVFFEQLAQHWTEHAVVEKWDTEAEKIISREGGDGLGTFLREHAVGHMGWTETTTAVTTTTTTTETSMTILKG